MTSAQSDKGNAKGGPVHRETGPPFHFSGRRYSARCDWAGRGLGQ